jgi:ectoine hydroxylase-related dioxygenase (phytanoyl-CoA dioxygenase family)
MGLTVQERREYAEFGYVVVHDCFDADEALAMQLELERMRRDGRMWDVGQRTVVEGAALNLHLNPSAHSALFRASAWAPQLTEAASELVGEPLAFQQDQAFYKPPRTGLGTGWHQDNAYFGHADPTRGVGIWIPLHEATIANGTMHVIPGSHRAAIAHAKTAGTYLQHAEAVDEAAAVPIELAVGAALFFNNGVLHCTKDNRSDLPRAAFALHYVNGDHARPGTLGETPRIIPAAGDLRRWRSEVERVLSGAALAG